MNRVIEIPLEDSVVEINVQDLEESFSQILELLETESSPLSLFTTFAVFNICLC